MVKQLKIVAALLATATLLLAGCKNISTSTVQGGSLGRTSDIAVIITNVDSARYLAPAALTTGTAAAPNTEISYYTLVGESLEGTVYAYKATSATAANATASPKVPAIAEGDNKILPATLLGTGADVFTLKDMPIDDWTFTLTACDVDGNALLKGTSVCQLKSAAVTTVAFTLSSVDVASKGGYNITLKYNNDDGSWKTNNYNFTYGLYDTVTGALAKGTTATNIAKTTADAIVVTTGGTEPGKDVTSGGLTVNPGSYVFGITIFDTNAKKLAYVSDIILIEPGRTTTGTIEIKEAIATAPAAPTDLIAQRITTLEDGDSYVVRFRWADASNNESQFKFVLKEFTGTAPTDTWKQYVAGTVAPGDTAIKESLDATLEDKSTPYVIPDDIKVYTWDSVQTLNSGAIRYVGGSLYAGSTELVLRLPTGHLYDAQIYAVNDIGWSDACVRIASNSVTELSSATTTSETTTKVAAISGKTPAGYGITNTVNSVEVPVRINLTRISYNLDGGQLKLNGTDATISTQTYVVYQVYNLNTGAGANAAYAVDDANNEFQYIPLLDAKQNKTFADSVYPCVQSSSGVGFSAWVYALAGTGQKTAIKHNVNTYQNITVTAQYGITKHDITLNGVDIESLPTMSDGDVVITYGTDVTAPNTQAIPGTGISKKRGSATPYYVTVKITPKATFVRYMLYAMGKYVEEYRTPSTVPDDYSFTNIPVADLKVGVQNEFIVVGITADGKHASVRKTVYVTNN